MKTRSLFVPSMLTFALSTMSGFAAEAGAGMPVVMLKPPVVALPVLAGRANQFVPSLPGEIVTVLPQQMVRPLPGQIRGSLPGQIVRALPGQVVPALPGQIVPPLPGQIIR